MLPNAEAIPSRLIQGLLGLLVLHRHVLVPSAGAPQAYPQLRLPLSPSLSPSHMGRLARFIEPQVSELCRFPDLHFRVDDFSSGTGNQDYLDRFSVGVPCCSRHVTWHVMFDTSRPQDAPDVIFAEEDDAFEPLIASAASDSPEVASRSWAILTGWHSADRTRLLKLILTLRGLYLKHHWALAETVDDARIRFELSTLAHTPGTEVFVQLTGQWGARQAEHVYISVPISEVDFIALSPFHAFSSLSMAPSATAAASSSSTRSSTLAKLTLQMKFPINSNPTNAQSSNSSNSNQLPQVKLECPPVLDALLSLSEFRMPAWTDTMCTMEYEPLLREQLQSRINEAAAGLHSRATFVSALGSTLGTPLESDTVLFLRSTFLLGSGPFVFLLHVLLSPKFPKVQPSLQFQSSQHFDATGRPIFSQVFDAYPWSPRWDAPEMTKRIIGFLLDKTPRFKTQCG